MKPMAIAVAPVTLAHLLPVLRPYSCMIPKNRNHICHMYSGNIFASMWYCCLSMKLRLPDKRPTATHPIAPTKATQNSPCQWSLKIKRVHTVLSPCAKVCGAIRKRRSQEGIPEVCS